MPFGRQRTSMIECQTLRIGGTRLLRSCREINPDLGGEDLRWRTSKTCARKDRSQAVNASSRRLVFGDSFDGGSRQIGRQ